MTLPSPFGRLAAFTLLLASLTSCEDAVEEIFKRRDRDKQPESKLDISFYALSGDNKLDAYSTKQPARSSASAAITGLQAGERILAIDFRPATGQLYGLGSTSRLYVINPKTGGARAIGAGAFTPALQGNLVGFDFNPTVDRIRIVTNTGQNLRANPETGTIVATDGSINGAPGAILTAVAYDNNFAGTADTELYALDVTNKKLYELAPPNNGTLVFVGDLKLNISGNGGYDIDARTNTGLGLFDVDGKSTLFTVDAETGKTHVLATYDRDRRYTGIAIPTKPVAYAVSPTNNLLIFDPTYPSAIVSKPITGLTTGDNVVGLDFRPVNGQLYALGSGSRLYTLNASSGAAMLVASLSTPLMGANFGFDFNPVVDRIRIVSNTGQNLRVNPTDGVAIVDGRLNPGAPSVSAAAYENNFAGTTATTLYVIDHMTDKFYEQSPPNAGTLVEVGDLGINVEAVNGYDIGGTSDTGYAILTVGGSTKLYTIDDESGKAKVANDYSFASAVTGFTVGLGF